jgi:hypothetical protein
LTHSDGGLCVLLSAAQLQTLKSDVAANTNVPGGTSIYAATPINTIPLTGDGDQAIADWYNGFPAPDFFVYRSNVLVKEINDQIQWAKLTPNDAPDTTQIWLNRAMQCQGKQFNLQILLQGLPTVDASKANFRAGLQDALTNVPSGVAGALVSAGWVGVRDNALARKATRVEKILATGDGSTAALAATLGAEGLLTYHDVDAARNAA